MLATLALALSLLSPVGPNPAAGLGPERPLPIAKPFLQRRHKFIVCAHRGDHTVAPENTLDAIEEAIKVGVDFVELDLRTSKDGVIVLMHDGTVNRTTTGAGKVSDLTFAELRALKIKGARRETELVPTFEEALALTRGKVRIYMDIKAVTPEQVLPLLKKHRMERNVIAYTYGADHRDVWRKGAPKIPLISDISDMKSPAQIETEFKLSPFAITDGNAFEYTSLFIETWHKLGVVVVPDIQNPAEGPEQWQPLIDAGVDGFQTDHPGKLVDYLKSKGIR